MSDELRHLDRLNAFDLSRHLILRVLKIVLSLHAHPNAAVAPKYFASRNAVSAVTGVSLRTRRSIRVRGTSQARATT
jgi:hypothetical protein